MSAHTSWVSRPFRSDSRSLQLLYWWSSVECARTWSVGASESLHAANSVRAKAKTRRRMPGDVSKITATANPAASQVRHVRSEKRSLLWVSGICDTRGVRRALLLGALVGCSPGAPTGGGLGDPCTLQEPCGAGTVCDYSSVQPTCLDETADPDGDGIPNKMDHCPTVTGGLYDEDGDGIGDDCDRCPIAKPPAVPDQDGDDVDSPCAPDPKTAGDKILLFDGFSGTTLDPRWTAVTPSAWSVEGGELVVRLATQDTQDFISTSVVPEPNLAVQSSYRVDKVEASSTTHIVSALAIDQRPAGVSSLECGVVKSDDGTAGEVVDLETDQSAVSHAAMIGAFDSARLYRNAMEL